MIDALIGGELYDKPQARTAKNGNPFATAKVRASTRDGEALFVNIIAFSTTAVSALLALSDGDSVAVAGELTAGGYLDKTGEPRPSLELLAHQVLTQYHVQRKRAAVKDQDGGPREAASQATPKPASEPMQREAEFDDSIPF